MSRSRPRVDKVVLVLSSQEAQTLRDTLGSSAAELNLIRAITAQTEPSPHATATPRVYLDLHSGHLPQAEMENLLMAPPVVRDHAYGAWVQVPPAQTAWQDDRLNPDTDEEWADFPCLNKVLLAARELGADWVNFDEDGFDLLAGLPTFGW